MHLRAKSQAPPFVARPCGAGSSQRVLGAEGGAYFRQAVTPSIKFRYEWRLSESMRASASAACAMTVTPGPAGAVSRPACLRSRDCTEAQRGLLLADNAGRPSERIQLGRELGLSGVERALNACAHTRSARQCAAHHLHGQKRTLVSPSCR